MALFNCKIEDRYNDIKNELERIYIFNKDIDTQLRFLMGLTDSLVKQVNKLDPNKQSEFEKPYHKVECGRYCDAGYMICHEDKGYGTDQMSLNTFGNKGARTSVRVNFCPWCGKPAKKQQHLIETEGK